MRWTGAYIAYAAVFRYGQGLRAVLPSSGAVGNGQGVLDAGCGTGLSTLALIETPQTRGSGYRAIHAYDFTFGFRRPPRRVDAEFGALVMRGVSVAKVAVFVLADTETHGDLARAAAWCTGCCCGSSVRCC